MAINTSPKLETGSSLSTSQHKDISKGETSLFTFGRKLNSKLGSLREEEYEEILKFVGNSDSVLDVGCGTGTLLARNRKNFVGIDTNEENVHYCREKGLRAEVGSALEIPFPENSFEVTICSHVMQVFQPSEAVTLVKELARVTKPGGKIVISTLNWFPRFWRHPENARPYPPEVFKTYSGKQGGSQSPMWPGMPVFEKEGIWLRRPSLFELVSYKSATLNGIFQILNRLQYVLRIRKWWAFDAYIISLRNIK